MATRSLGTVGLACALAMLACAGDDGDSGSGDTSADNCACKAGGYAPVCGVDGTTYDAICGLSCVPVEIECMGSECPCPEPTSGPGDTSADSSGGGTSGGGGVDTGSSSGGSEGGSGETGAMTLMCGDLVCGTEMPVCVATLGGVMGRPTYECGRLPPMCDGVAVPSCDCVSPVGCDCTEPQPGLFSVSCAAP